MGSIRAHIFKRRRRGDREEVDLKLFKADGTAMELGSGGSGEGSKKVEIVLDHAAILTLMNNRYELIAPTEPDLNYDLASSFPVMIQAFFMFQIGNNPYGNLNLSKPNQLLLCHGIDESADHSILADVSTNTDTGDLSFGVSDMRYVMTNLNATRYGRFWSKERVGKPEFQDNGLYLMLWGPDVSGPLTGGSVDDKLKIILWYEIIETL